MKQLFVAMVLLLSLSNSFAQTVLEASEATTLSPSITATLTSIEVTAASELTTLHVLASQEARGTAGVEQIKDELTALHDDMEAGKVKTIDEVRQPALKELFFEIVANEEDSQKIERLVKNGSQLEKLTTVVTSVLLQN